MSSKVVKVGDVDRDITSLTVTGWLVWVIVSILNWFFIAILVGTSETYWSTQLLIFGLYIAWDTFFYMIGFSLWLIFSAFILKFFKKQTTKKGKKLVKQRC